jgi:hypothetical protein
MSTFCLVHGSTQSATGWDRLVLELERRGHQTITPTLPTDRPDASAIIMGPHLRPDRIWLVVRLSRRHDADWRRSAAADARAAVVGFMLVGCTMAGAVAFWILMHHAFGAIIPGGLLLAVAGFGWPEVARFVSRVRQRAAFR